MNNTIFNLCATHSNSHVLSQVLLLCSAIAFSINLATANVETEYVLPPDEWHQIVIPASLAPGEETVADTFGDDFKEQLFNKSWVLYRYDDSSGDYSLMTLDKRMVPGEAYWIIQIGEASVTIDLPDSATRMTGIPKLGCLSDGCILVSLADKWTDTETRTHWRMVGKPSLDYTLISQLQVVTLGSDNKCGSLLFPDCNMNQSLSESLTDNTFFYWDPALGDYVQLFFNDPLPDWQGLWLQSLESAPEDAELQHSRFLSFPVVSALDEGYSCSCRYFDLIAEPVDLHAPVVGWQPLGEEHQFASTGENTFSSGEILGPPPVHTDYAIYVSTLLARGADPLSLEGLEGTDIVVFAEIEAAYTPGGSTSDGYCLTRVKIQTPFTFTPEVTTSVATTRVIERYEYSSTLPQHEHKACVERRLNEYRER